jgi:hypothetical protein
LLLRTICLSHEPLMRKAVANTLMRTCFRATDRSHEAKNLEGCRRQRGHKKLKTENRNKKGTKK